MTPHTSIQGALRNFEHEAGRGTIASILKENGIDLAPERGKRTRWSTFLKAHWECVTAADFLSVEVCTLKGLVTHYVLFFIDLASRTVHVAGVTARPDHACMMQVARNVTDVGDGILRGKRYLILDRDAKYTEGFRSALLREGLEVIRLPVPRAKSECLCGKVRENNQGGVFESNGFLRSSIASACDKRVRGALSRGT